MSSHLSGQPSGLAAPPGALRWAWLLLFGCAIAAADASASLVAAQLDHVAAIWLANAIVVAVIVVPGFLRWRRWRRAPRMPGA